MYWPEYRAAIKDGNLLELIVDYFYYKKNYANSIHKKKYDEIKLVKRRLRLSDKLRKEIYDKIDLDSIHQNSVNLEHVHNNTVWFLWYQGIENAPELVKMCYKSVLKNICELNNWNMIVISKENIQDYCDIPELIWDKVDNGQISLTHLSDIIRLELLIKHGGLWIDSTVLVTGNRYISLIEKADLFAPSKWIWFDTQPFSCDSWLIYSKTNNERLIVLRECLYKYWETHNQLIEYFLFHVFWEIVMKKDDYEKKMPYLSVHSCEYLQSRWSDKFEKEKVECILNQTDFHKLSYKRLEEVEKESIGEYFINLYSG